MGCVACDLLHGLVGGLGAARGKREGKGKMGRYLVAETLGGDDGDFIADTLVGFEVEGELWVVALDDYFGGFFDGLLVLLLASLLRSAWFRRLVRIEEGGWCIYLCANATHLGGLRGRVRGEML
jgi:hypothetical protein